MSLPADFTIIGHRGAAGLLPENTLPGFIRALALGCRWLELDVHCLTSSAELAVIHDAKLDRTTSARGPVSALQLVDLAAIDAGNQARIPLLQEVCAAISEFCAQHALAPAAITLNIELKGKATATPVAEFVKAGRHLGLSLVVSSFDHKQLATFRGLDGDTPLALLYDRWRTSWPATAAQLHASAINLAARICTAERVAAIQAAGFAVYAYTVNDYALAEQLAGWGVRGIFTDRPDLFLT